MIRFRAPFEDEWSRALFAGPDAGAAESILAAKLIALDYEVTDEDGVDYEEAEHDA